MPLPPYTPVDCTFHDHAESTAVRRVPVRLAFADAEGERTLTARIVDVYARDGADWVEIDGVGPVRMDQLVSIGDVARPVEAVCRVQPGG
jgi:hypothetical protein